MSVEGVVTVEVSFDDAQAVVTLRRDQVTGLALVRAVQDAGFDAQVVEEHSSDSSRAARTSAEQP